LCHELEALVEPAQDIQHHGAVLDGLAEVGEGICHGLHLAGVGVDGEGALGEGAELGVEEHGARLAIVQEFLFEAEPSDPSRDAVTVVDGVQEAG
jgi:hypothetical protein